MTLQKLFLKLLGPKELEPNTCIYFYTTFDLPNGKRMIEKQSFLRIMWTDDTHYHCRKIDDFKDKREYKISKWRKPEVMDPTWAITVAANANDAEFSEVAKWFYVSAF